MTTIPAFEAHDARRRRPTAAGCERCSVCAGALEHRHHHCVELEDRRILCACRTCWLSGRAGDRARPIPSRVLRDPAFALDEAQWSALGVPVRLAFLFFNSARRRWVSVFPGPAGPIESELPPTPWLSEATLPSRIAPDVEALLIYGRAGRAYDAVLAPIDECYELLAVARQRRSAFQGGDQAWSAVDELFTSLRARAFPVDGGGW